MSSNSSSPEPVQQQIDAVAKLEGEALASRTTVERIGDAIGSFVGRMTFVVLHLFWFVFWILMNTGHIPGIAPFDPYPFILLSMIVSLEGVLLTTFVLMKQYRMSRRADQRAQLDLQINLLAEKEATKTLQLLQRICEHLGLEAESRDSEVAELSQTTAIDTLAEDLKRKLPDE